MSPDATAGSGGVLGRCSASRTLTGTSKRITYARPPGGGHGASVPGGESLPQLVRKFRMYSRSWACGGNADCETLPVAVQPSFS